jgi:hypothetical protein
LVNIGNGRNPGVLPAEFVPKQYVLHSRFQEDPIDNSSNYVQCSSALYYLQWCTHTIANGAILKWGQDVIGRAGAAHMFQLQPKGCCIFSNIAELDCEATWICEPACLQIACKKHKSQGGSAMFWPGQ